MSGSFADSAFFPSGGASLVTRHTYSEQFCFCYVCMIWEHCPIVWPPFSGGSEFTKLPKGIQVALRAQIRLDGSWVTLAPKFQFSLFFVLSFVYNSERYRNGCIRTKSMYIHSFL